MQTPYELFSYFFIQELLELMSMESTLYSGQTNTSKPCNITVDDIRKLFGNLCPVISNDIEEYTDVLE